MANHNLPPDTALLEQLESLEKELALPEASRTLDLLAALSHHSAMSLGCYCEDEARCHRSVLRAELHGRGADLAG